MDHSLKTRTEKKGKDKKYMTHAIYSQKHIRMVDKLGKRSSVKEEKEKEKVPKNGKNKR